MRFQLFFAALCFSNLIIAQKYDYVWVIGDNNNLTDTTHGGTTIDFSQTPVKAIYHYRQLNMFLSNTSISNASGELLFYSNGCDVAGKDDLLLSNGEGLNPGSWHTILCDQNHDGYALGYPGIFILPKPDSSEVYNIIHQSVKHSSSPVPFAFVDKLLFTTVRSRDSKMVVEEKNVPIMNDSLAAGEMNAVKHANGKDWWIIMPRRNSNQFYIFLYTKEGVIDTIIQTVGDKSPPQAEGYGQTTFSPLGDKMVRYYPALEIRLYTFDRAIGQFTDYSTFPLNVGNSISFDGGCAFSPNGRYLYIAALTNIYQFDMESNNIASSQTTVATWDGFADPIAITFWHSQLGPDCKIYINGGGDTRYYHIIHNPDEPGLACNVEQRGLKLPTPSGASIPYFPNYRLGPIDNPGLPCSPVVATGQPALPMPGISAWPNPAGRQLSFGPLPPEAKALRLYDVYGRVAKELSLTGGNEVYTLSVEDLAAGLYFWEVSGTRGHASGKVNVIMR